MQIYDITTRVWRLGAPPPKSSSFSQGIVIDAKLFVVEYESMMVYDPQVDSWTEEEIPWGGQDRWQVKFADAHDGSIVAFTKNIPSPGSAFQRASDGSWSPYEGTRPISCDAGGLFSLESVLLG